MDKTLPAQVSSRSKISDSAASRWILFAAAIWCICWFVHALHYWEDDAYIHLEFARSVATGHGYSFNGRLTNGDTSPLWVLMLAAVHAFIPRWLVAGKVLTVLGTIFTLTGVYCFSKHLVKDLNGAQTFAASMVLLLVTNPYFCYWSFSGMETLTALGLAFWGTLIAVKERPTWPSFLLGCFVIGIAPVLRPEMMAFSGLAGLLLLKQWSDFQGRPASPKKIFGLLLALFLVVLPVALWSAYAIHAFGHVIPNTNAAKRAGEGGSVLLRILEVYSLGFPVIVAELPGLAVLALIRPSVIRKDGNQQNPLSLFPVEGWIFLIWCAVAVVFYLLDQTKVQTRYILVMAPGLLIALLAFNYRRLPPWFYRASLIGALLLAVPISAVSGWLLIRNKVLGDKQVQIMADYVRHHVPADQPIAVYAIGELAFDSQHPIIDTGGITRPGVIQYMYGDSGGVVQWARQQGAKYYLSDEAPEPGSTLVFSVRTPIVGWYLDYRSYSRSGLWNLWKLPGSQTGPEPVLIPGK